MQKLLAFIFIIIATAAIAQTSAPTGIGPFKIGVTTILKIDSLKKGYGMQSIPKLKSKQVPVPTLGEHLDVSLCELVADTVDYKNDNINLMAVKGARVFLLNEFSIAGIKLENLYLTFYHDTLVRIVCNEGSSVSQIKKALEVKYGEGEKSEQNGPSPCIIDGEAKMQSGYTEMWRNGKIITVCYESVIYLPNCNEAPLCMFLIHQRDLYDVLDSLKQKELEKFEQQKEMKEKRKLSEF